MPGRGKHSRQGERRLVFRGTRMPVTIVFDNLEAGASIEDIMEWFDVSRQQVTAVLDFAARSLEAPAPAR